MWTCGREDASRHRRVGLREDRRHRALRGRPDADLGDRFLLDRGFTLVWVGWEFPTPRAIERSRWSLDGGLVMLNGGFEAGRIYRVSYRAKTLPISGLGLAAFRDTASWVKYAPDALATAKQTLAFGSSQRGRFLRTFLYNGLNGDEKGRQVFDAVWMHIAGAAGRYPRLADGTLVPASAVKFPAIPGVQSPTIVEPLRRDGKPVPFLVSQVDADGSEVAGVRTAESMVPLATYTGWNFRNRTSGGPTLLVSLLGSRIPFPATAAEASAAKNPRAPIAERYASRDAYLAKAHAVTDALVKGGYLLSGDVPQVMRRVEQQWDVVVGR